MKLHTVFGARLFPDLYSELDEAAASVALNHHEHWDGNGYPGHVSLATLKPLPGYEQEDGRARGKKGEEIPLFGRIVAIADVYDALSNRRCYKEAWDESAVLEELRKDSGCVFDPELMEVFLREIETFRQIAIQFPDAHS